MAEVFLAVVAGPGGFNKLQVVKLMKPELLEEPEHKTMFLEESRLAARLNHTNIVQTNEVEIQGDQYFMSMEYLDGQPLHRILRRAAKTKSFLPLHWHLHFLTGVLSALDYAHNLADYDGTPLKVVHRDVTPHNVFVTYNGQVKLCDFGIAKTMSSSVETRAGVIKGKVAYMSPEQVLSERIDHRADLFAVGVMLWEAATGTRMWQGQSELQIMQALSQGQIPSALAANADVDPELATIVGRALAPRPEDRYQSARELRTALESFLFAHTARVDTHAVGDFVAKLFEKERANLQAVIQDQMTGSHSAPGAFDSVLPPPMARANESSPSKSVQASGPAGASAASAGGHGSLTIPSVEVRALRPRRTFAAAVGVAAALGIFLVLGVGALILRALRPEPVPEVEGIKATTEGESAGSLPSTSASAPSTSPATTRVQLRIAATPRSAKIFIDGKPVPDNPYVVDRAPDGSEHEVRFEAPGYESQIEKLRFEGNVNLDVPLKRVTGQAKAPAPTPPTGKPTATGLPELKPTKKPGGAPLDPEDPWGK